MEDTRMKYVEASKLGGPEVLKVIDKKTPRPGGGTLLVEVRAAGVNYADVIARSGFYPAVTKAPFALGFEIAGVAREVGKGADGFKSEGKQTLEVEIRVNTAAKPKQIDTKNLDGPEEGLYLRGLRTGWRHAPDFHTWK
jgi:NADPH:quinone reductase-like Zn-dependent oxidoreductase